VVGMSLLMNRFGIIERRARRTSCRVLPDAYLENLFENEHSSKPLILLARRGR
jgi:hypothetical protein